METGNIFEQCLFITRWQNKKVRKEGTSWPLTGFRQTTLITGDLHGYLSNAKAMCDEQIVWLKKSLVRNFKPHSQMQFVMIHLMPLHHLHQFNILFAFALLLLSGLAPKILVVIGQCQGWYCTDNWISGDRATGFFFPTSLPQPIFLIFFHIFDIFDVLMCLTFFCVFQCF